MNIVEEKRTMRRAAKTARADAASAEKAAQAVRNALKFFGPSNGRCLAAYLPIGSELDPTVALEVWCKGAPTALPIAERNKALTFCRWSPGDPTRNGAFNVPVPEIFDAIRPDILIVPLLAFDARGYRLGYGGGHYDRTLHAMRGQGGVLAVGIAFAAQEVAHVPTEQTDQALDAIVTENGVFEAP